MSVMDDGTTPRLTMLADCIAEPLELEQLDWCSSLPEPLILLLKEVAKLGGGCWLVGGAVREAMLGGTAFDWDLATTVNPIRLMGYLKDLQNKEVRVYDTGLRYGTITVIWSGITMEVTTLRTESSYADGRRPEIVDFGESLLQDLKRRDFTVNSMAIDVQRGLLHDPNLGMLDLKNECIRAVGNPRRRIAEDGLRLLRAYRFMDRGEYGCWSLDSELNSALESEQHMLDKVASERKWTEMQRILCGHNSGVVLRLMAEHGVLSRLLGDDFHSDEHCIRAQFDPILTDEIPAAMRLALIFANRTSEDLSRAADMLILSNKERAQAHLSHRLLGNPPSHNDRGMMRLWRFVAGDITDYQIRIESAWASANGDNLSALREQMSELPPLRAGPLPLANGEWIMKHTELGKGKRLGRLKQWLHQIQIVRDLSDIEDVEDVLSILHWQHSDFEQWPRVDWPA